MIQPQTWTRWINDEPYTDSWGYIELASNNISIITITKYVGILKEYTQEVTKINIIYSLGKLYSHNKISQRFAFDKLGFDYSWLLITWIPREKLIALSHIHLKVL